MSWPMDGQIFKKHWNSSVITKINVSFSSDKETQYFGSLVKLLIDKSIISFINILRTADIEGV